MAILKCNFNQEINIDNIEEYLYNEAKKGNIQIFTYAD